MKKKNLFFGIMLLFAIALVTTCDKKDDNDTNNTPATCDDGILNQGEEGIDCGGPCPPCVQNIMTAKVNGTYWTASSFQCQYLPGDFYMEGIETIPAITRIRIYHKGDYTTGTFTLDNSSFYTDAGSNMYDCQTGSVTFTEWDVTNKIISGTFTMTASDGATTFTITDGVFQDVLYQVK